MLKKQYSKSKPVCKVTFSLPKEAAAGAKEVKVLGDFNNWSWNEGLSMKSGKDGYKATVELTTGRQYEFRYLLDNGNWVNDWEADAYHPTPYGEDNCVVFVETVKVSASKPKKAAAKAPAKKAKSTKAAAAKVAPKKSKTAAAKSGKKAVAADDLKKIEGIGPKIAGLLKAKDIHTFADLAKAKKSTLSAVLADAGSRFKMHDPSSWPQQAKLAVKGEWEKLAKLQGELKGGKKKK